MGDMIMNCLSGWASDAIYAGGAFVAGAAATWIRNEIKGRTCLERGMRALLKAELRRLHERAMNQGFITYEQLSAAQEDYAIYHDINGNGTGTAMIKDMEALPLHKEGVKNDAR